VHGGEANQELGGGIHLGDDPLGVDDDDPVVEAREDVRRQGRRLLGWGRGAQS